MLLWRVTYRMASASLTNSKANIILLAVSKLTIYELSEKIDFPKT
jgi:hypothetical protein